MSFKVIDHPQSTCFMCNSQAAGETFYAIAGERFKGSITRLKHLASNQMERITTSNHLIYPHGKTSGQVCENCRAIHEKDCFIFEQISMGFALFGLLLAMVYVWHCPDIVISFLQDMVQRYIPDHELFQIIIVPLGLLVFMIHFFACFTGLVGFFIFPLMAIYWLARPFLRIVGMAEGVTNYGEVLANTLGVETSSGRAEELFKEQLHKEANKDGTATETESEFTEELVCRIVEEKEYKNFDPEQPGEEFEWQEMTEHLIKGKEGTERFHHLSYITAMMPGMVIGLVMIVALGYYAHTHGEHGATVYEYVDYVFGTKYSIKS